MSKEIFQKEDIERYHKLAKEFRPSTLCKNAFNLWSVDIQLFHIKLPEEIFSYLIKTKRPEYEKYLPYNISLKVLERGDNEWLQESNYLGINDGNSLTLYLDKDVEHSEVSLLWVLFHEFRHKLQNEMECLESCHRNENREYWLNTFENLGDALHVYHEIDPSEVDANTFACEMLNIKYPGSKFAIDENRINKLKYKDLSNE